MWIFKNLMYICTFIFYFYFLYVFLFVKIITKWFMKEGNFLGVVEWQYKFKEKKNLLNTLAKVEIEIIF